MMAIILPDPQGLRYYRNEHDFLVGVELPKRKLGWRSYIEVHYDELGRVSQKLYFKRKGKIKQYQVMQYDSITAELSSRILLNEDSVVTSIFTFGSHQEKINKFLSYRAQMDSIQDEGDRFIETIFSKDALPEEYRLYDVNGSHFGTISLAYDDGGLLKQEDWITFPEEDVIRRFLFNNFPETGSIQILEYDSTLGQTHELWVLADGTTALISVDFPHSHSSVSSPHISYHLKEKLVEGWVTWEWLSGTVDSAAPYTAMLIPGEMMEGYHEETVLAYTPELKEGGVYKITFAGSGVSGYPAINVVIDSVTYDTTDPKIFVWCDSVINSPEVYLWASEPLLQMELLWYRWNEQDSLVQRAGNIIGKGLLSLTDDTVLFTVPALLEDGERYSLRTTAWDLAGNRGIGDTLTGIRYDITPPQFYYTTPKSGDFFNRSGVSYELSERAASGVLTWKWIAGVQDSIGLYTIPLSTSQLRQGWHEGVPEMGPPPLVEGAVYEVTLWAEDFAGNTSDKIGIAAVTYDTTAPIVEIMLPRTADAVKSAAVTYLTNETLSSAEINWSEVVFDTITITFQTESLSGDELSAGLHEYPGLPKGGRLRDGNTYRLSLSASDLAGNIAKPFIVEDVNFDTTGPFLADLEPHGGEFVQDERVSFYVDENLAQGVLTWRQIAGEYDPDSPHQISLEDEELKAGEHIDLFPMRGVYLHDGSIYELTFIAADRAGNSSNILVSDSIHFDNTPPQMVIFSPVEDNPIKSSEVVFTLSELLQELTMKWLWREGSLDTSAPHLLQLDKQYLQPGEHHFKDTESLLQLTEGASYDIVLHGRDKAGNEGSSAIITHLTYDIKAPEIIWSYPGDNEYITGVEVTYDLSETLKEGEIIWVWTGGEEDPDAPHKITLSTAERASGLHKNLVLKQAPLLVDGAMYHIRMRGSDAAGNQADPVAVTNVTLDISPPEIVVITPQPFSAVSTTSLYYTLSEDLARGTISWTWRRGSVDPKKVHHRSLQGEALGSGEHAELLFSPPVPLVDGALYTIELTGIDYAGNEASVMPISDVYYDATPPVITEASPFSNSYVNHTEVSYTFSENIQEGTITWHHKGGALDELAPHVVHLTGDELNSGHHSDLSLQEAPLLNDGSIYSIIFAVSDAAGNEAENIVLENIHYDISDPVVTILSPLSQSWIAAPTVGYELSENLARARFVWEWIGGSTDPSAPYFVDLIDDELTVGSHQEVMLAHSPQLVEGAIYDLSLEGEDFAGNPSPIATISALGFDATNPVISNVFPSSYSHINHPEVSYFLSENLAEGRMTWIEKGVTDEELSRQEIVLADRDREIGDHLGVSLNEKLVLKDGSHYDIYLEGEDAAGNRAEPVEIKDITYDITPPEMVLNFPEPGAYIRSGEIAYSSSELLSSAQVLWTQTGGVTESTSPYLVELVGEELKSGEHPLFLPDNTPDFSDGAVFSVKLVGTDLAGNYSSAVEIFEVHLDIDPPMIAGFAPESNSYVNHSRIRYELSENIAVGQIVWEQTGGVNDPATPHIVELVGEELRVGVHPGRELSAQSELVNGSIYSLIFTAVDSAGNAAESVEVNGIQYDIIPPEIVVTQPRIGDYLQSPHLLYELSETCAFAKAVWKWTGGTEDSLLTHTQEMTGEELIEGEHDESLDDKVQLIDGAEYQLTITLQDLAGNDGIPVNITDLYYDSTPPEI
ncbi:MAG: Ig-like domain-containing protein, partial [Fidelibacterota bacterium]